MADDYDVVSLLIERPLSAVGDWDVLEIYPRFENEAWYDSEVLIWDESRERVFGLVIDTF